MGCIRSKPVLLRSITEVDQILLTPGLFVHPNTKNFFEVYKLGKRLGKGSFGEVRLCTHKASEVQRAVKLFRKLYYKTPRQKLDLAKELEILKSLDHPNIIRVYESFEDEDCHYIVMEHCKGGELFKEILKQKHFNESQSAEVMKQLLSAILYLHENSIIHRDLKPENILFEEKNGMIKLIDFGAATKFRQGKTIRGAIGSAFYIAPEVLTDSYGPKCDLWSAGVILYILLCGYPPFEGESDEEVIAKVRKGIVEFPLEDWAEVSQEAKCFIQKLICPEKQRINASQALKEPWLLSLNENKKPENKVVERLLRQMQEFKHDNKLIEAVQTFITSQFLDPADIKEARDVFLSLDADGDGRLSKDELMHGYSNIFGEETEQVVNSVMNQVDFDRSGFVDYTEFLRSTVDKHKIVSDQNVKSAFDLFDTDGIGHFSERELKRVLGGNSQSNEDVWKEIIREADQNGDGEIDMYEFKNVVLASV